jgi:hypothetical protein
MLPSPRVKLKHMYLNPKEPPSKVRQTGNMCWGTSFRPLSRTLDHADHLTVLVMTRKPQRRTSHPRQRDDALKGAGRSCEALQEQEDVELEMPGSRCRQSPNSFRTSWQLCLISGIDWDKDMAGTVGGGRLCVGP